MNEITIHVNGRPLQLSALALESILSAAVNMVDALDDGFSSIVSAGDTLCNRLHIHGIIEHFDGIEEV